MANTRRRTTRSCVGVCLLGLILGLAAIPAQAATLTYGLVDLFSPATGAGGPLVLVTLTDVGPAVQFDITNQAGTGTQLDSLYFNFAQGTISPSKLTFSNVSAAAGTYRTVVASASGATESTVHAEGTDGYFSGTFAYTSNHFLGQGETLSFHASVPDHALSVADFQGLSIPGSGTGRSDLMAAHIQNLPPSGSSRWVGTVAVVPVPMATVLFGIGVIGMVAISRRSRSEPVSNHAAQSPLVTSSPLIRTVQPFSVQQTDSRPSVEDRWAPDGRDPRWPHDGTDRDHVLPLATILLIAAHERRAWSLQRLLNDAGYLTVLACTEVQGLAELRARRPTLLIVDRASSACARLGRAVLAGHPSLMMTLHTHASDCTGEHTACDLENGAHVTLCNPSPRLLVAMIRAMLRRERAASQGSSSAAVNRIHMDLDRHEVLVDQQPVDLTPKEFLLLQALLEHPGGVCSKQMLQDRVWGSGHAVSHNVVSVYMHLLRRKLERDPSRPRLLYTMPGLGYKLRADQPAASSAAAPPRRLVRRAVVRSRLVTPRGRSDAQARRSLASAS